MGFSEKLREIRKESGMSQKEAAQKLGLSPSGYAAWELGNTVPDVNRVNRIVQVFNVSADYLLEIKGAANEPLVTVSAEATLPKNEREWLKAYRSLTDEEKKQVEDFAEYMGWLRRLTRFQVWLVAKFAAPVSARTRHLTDIAEDAFYAKIIATAPRKDFCLRLMQGRHFAILCLLGTTARRLGRARAWVRRIMKR